MPADDDIPIDDPIAQQTRRALDHLAGDTAPRSSWADVSAGAQHATRVRRSLVAGGCALVIGAVAFAAVAASGTTGHHDSVIVAEGESSTTSAAGTEPTTATTLAPDETTTDTAAGTDGSSVPAGACTTCPPTTDAPTTEPPQDAGVGDFSGRVILGSRTATVGQGVTVQLNIRNETDHDVDPSAEVLLDPMLGHPIGVGLACTTDVTTASNPRLDLVLSENFWPVKGPVLAPNDEGGVGPFTFMPTADSVGTVTCAAVIFSLPSAMDPITVVGLITGIDPQTITVSPAPSGETPTSIAP